MASLHLAPTKTSFAQTITLQHNLAHAYYDEMNPHSRIFKCAYIRAYLNGFKKVRTPLKYILKEMCVKKARTPLNYILRDVH